MSANPEGLKKPSLFHILIIATLAIGLYSNTLKNGFVYDDKDTILNNTLIKSLDNLPLLFDKTVYFSRSEEMSYRPVVTVTYFIDYALYRLNPWGFHLTNILLHAVNGVLLYSFLTMLLTPHSSRLTSLPFLISLFFVSHPVLTEAVNCISYREDLLAFLFYMTTLNLYLILRAKLPSDQRPLATALLYPLSCLIYVLALLSKEMAVTLPLIIFCYEWLYERENTKLSSRLFNCYIIGYIAITFFYLYLRFSLFHSPKEQVEAWSLVERFLTLPWLITTYLKLSLIPVPLSADYVINPVSSPFSPIFILSLIALVSVLTAILIMRNRERQILFSSLFFLLTLIPVYNLAPLSNPLAERYLYLPMAGFVMSAVYIAYFIAQKLETKSTHGNRYMPTFLLIVLLIFSFSVVKRNTLWKDSYSLWSDTVAKMPDSARAHNNLGRAYYDRGRIDEAIAEFLAAIKLKRNYAEGHNNLAAAYLRQGRYDEAIYELKKVLNSNMEYPYAYINLGIIYGRQGLLDQAINELHTAIRLKPDSATAHYNLGVAYSGQGRHDEAISEFSIALKLKPDYKEAYQNVEVLMQKRGVIKDADSSTSKDKTWSP